MNATTPQQIMQRWQIVQGQLIPALHQEIGLLTPKLEKLIHILEWSRIEEFVTRFSYRTGRPPHELAWLANAFVAKVVLGLTTTVHLIERLNMDKALQRICGFPLHKKLPSASTFSRAFETFAKDKLAERAHEVLIKMHFGDRLIGHISRDGTAIKVRERPQKIDKVDTDKPKLKGRPRKDKDENRPIKFNVARQRTQCLEEMLNEIPVDCRRGTKCNAQGYKNSWNGYKLHLDIADCGVPISALLSSASMHDSRAAIPLSHISAARVTNLYDLMDAAYCSIDLHEHSRELGHVPLIDHNPRGGEKEEFEPADTVRYRERSGAERANGRLKDEFGGRHIWVRGEVKVMSHLMFGILVLSVDQLLRLRQ
ncbi:transposase [Marinomonas sp. IMCC 4694]|uniref:transposase n=1 Tax=Marinomonas sp. IMCC 4694 TaxID=2605432 RepID=UPI001CA35E89|nr:transposase [Marinomonas sp. IMCC 4694]